MTFYLRPPDQGDISLVTFSAYAQTRLRFLTLTRSAGDNLITEKNLPPHCLQYSDALIEGTAKDRISHFALRVVSLLHAPLHDFVVRKESLLFTRRLSKMNYPDRKKSVLILMKQLEAYKNDDEQSNPVERQFFAEFLAVLTEIVKRRVLKELEGDEIVVAVPWNHVLVQVRTRDVVLIKGQAQLAKGQVSSYLTQSFRRLLEYSSRRMRESGLLRRMEEDQRFFEMIAELKKIWEPCFKPLELVPRSGLTLEDLDRMSLGFPACMRAMHHTLRQRHRLCHTPRVQYTLFLKDVGLPIQHFLQLLESEYRKPAVQGAGGHRCEHAWASDARRYTYGSRHLYGLEGKRTNYSSHTCATIQKGTPQPNACGGCPFAHFDAQNLRSFLVYDLGAVDADALLSQTQTKCQRSGVPPAIEACHLHLRLKYKQLSSGGELSSEAASRRHHKPQAYFNTISPIMYEQG